MTFILPRDLSTGIPSPFLVVCEGMADARFTDQLLIHNDIKSCSVGCPSRDSAGGEGKDRLPTYLANIKAVMQLRSITLKGLLLVADADDSKEASFTAIRNALKYAEFPEPAKPFSIEELNPRMAIYLIPGEGREGTLEHLLLEAAFAQNKATEKCIDVFFDCVGRVKCSANKDAKMRMSALVGATCKDNPWASAAVLWSDKGNPVPIDSLCFGHLVDFLKKLSA